MFIRRAHAELQGRLEQHASLRFGFWRNDAADYRHRAFDARRKVNCSVGLVVCRDVADDAMCCSQSKRTQKDVFGWALRLDQIVQAIRDFLSKGVYGEALVSHRVFSGLQIASTLCDSL
jgi:hypothetical protein